MNKIKICDQNREEINKLIHDIEKQSRLRTVTFADVQSLKSTANNILTAYHIPQGARKNIRFEYRQGYNKSPGRVPHQISTTLISIIYIDDWYLEDISRVQIKSTLESQFRMIPTESAINIVRNTAEKKFRQLEYF